MNNIQLVKNQEWKEVEVNGEIVEIPAGWEVENISKVTECWDNKRKPLNQQERGYMKGNIPYWGANNIVDYVNDYLVNEEVVLLGEDAAPFYDKTKKVAFVVNEKIWPNNHIHVLKPRINSYFLMSILNHVQYEKIIASESRPKLTQGMMNAIEFPLPQKDEPDIIASVLSHQESILQDIEILISKHESRFRYLSEEMLSGRLRVKEVEGKTVFYKNSESNLDIKNEWEEKKLGDITKVKRGTSLQSKNMTKGSIPVIAAGRSITDFHNQSNRPENTITISASGANAGYVAFWNTPIFASDCLTIQEDENFSIKWLYYVLKMKQVEIYDTQEGGGQPHVGGDDIKNLVINKPEEISEQVAISTILLAQESIIEEQKSLLFKEKQKFNWLLDNLLSGKYLVREVT